MKRIVFILVVTSSLISCYDEIIRGCIDCTACNYNSDATVDNNSCEHPEKGYDCEGNITDPYIGMKAFGGIVFYIDETRQHGLVAAKEDILEGANMAGFGTPDGYEWGCFGDSVAIVYENYFIGTGLENTNTIVNHGCLTDSGGITAAQAALNYQAEGYTDWYLPSRDELDEMYKTIGNGGPEGNVGGFESSDYAYYWSSSQINNSYASSVLFSSGFVVTNLKNGSLRVRAIRAF